MFLKYPFSGSSRCGSTVKIPRNINIFKIYNNLLKNYTKKYIKINDINFDYIEDYDEFERMLNLVASYKKNMNLFKRGRLTQEPEMPKEMKEADRGITINSCVGMYYGLILQPMNDNYKKFGEVRCICYKGDIKAVVLNAKNFSMPFFQKIIHKSVFEKRLEQIDDLLIKIICSKIVEVSDEWMYEGDSIMNLEVEDFNLKETNIIEYAKRTFNVLKQDLKIEGVHHRIDFVKSRDKKNQYVVNEVENINFGDAVNNSYPFQLDKNEFHSVFDYVTRKKINITELDQFQNFYTNNKEVLDKMLELSKDELLTIRRKINKFFDILKGMRDMVLIFDY